MTLVTDPIVIISNTSSRDRGLTHLFLGSGLLLSLSPGTLLTLAVSQSGLDGLDLLGGRVELLELTALAGEQDQAGLEVLQAGDVGDQRLLGVVGAAVVNRDADGGSELLGDAGFLWRCKSLHLLKRIFRRLPSAQPG